MLLKALEAASEGAKGQKERRQALLAVDDLIVVLLCPRRNEYRSNEVFGFRSRIDLLGNVFKQLLVGFDLCHVPFRSCVEIALLFEDVHQSDAYDTIHRYLTDNYNDENALLGLWGYLANNVLDFLLRPDVFPLVIRDDVEASAESLINGVLFYFIFTKTHTRDLERSFSSWADELREIAETADEAEQAHRLDKFITDHFQSSMASKSGELSDALRRYTVHSTQKYRTRYLLAKLTQHVDLAFKGLTSPGRLDEYTGLEMEHILPNTPSQELRASFTAQNPGANYDEYKNRLGNFTLLEKPINIVASNNFFEAKKAEYRKCKHYLTSSIAELATVGKNSSINRINEKLRSFGAWTATSIEERQALLIELMKDVWKTSLMDGQNPT